MAFQTRGYGKDVMRSDMLKQVMVREERQMLLGTGSKRTAAEIEKSRGYEALNIFGMGSYSEAHKANGRKARPLPPQAPDVQCKSIGHGVKQALPPKLKQKSKWVEPPPHIPAFQCLGQFDIGLHAQGSTAGSPRSQNFLTPRSEAVAVSTENVVIPPDADAATSAGTGIRDGRKPPAHRTTHGGGSGVDAPLPASAALAALTEDDDIEALVLDDVASRDARSHGRAPLPPKRLDTQSRRSHQSLSYYRGLRREQGRRGSGLADPPDHHHHAKPPSVIADDQSRATSFRTLDTASQYSEASRSQISTSRGGGSSMLPSVGYGVRTAHTARAALPPMSSPPSSYTRSRRYR